MKGIASIQRIIAKQSLWAAEPDKPSAEVSFLRDAYSRNITRQTAVWRQSRIILTLGIVTAVVWPRCEASTGLILVLELAMARAPVEFGAVGIVGDALHVEGAGGDFEATGAADLAMFWAGDLC